jgi:hypothetical protein
MSYRPKYEEVPNEQLECSRRVRILLEDARPRFNSQANDSVIVGALTSQVYGGENVPSRAEILAAIDRLWDERKIIYAPAVQQALNAAKEKHPMNSFDSQAAEKMILDKAEEIKFSITSGRDLADVCDWLIEQGGVPLSSAGEAGQQQVRSTVERCRMINEITSDYTKGFRIHVQGGAYSQRVYDKDGYEVMYSQRGGQQKQKQGGGFDSMSDPEVSAIHSQVMEERRLKGLSVKELRAEIAPVRAQAYIDSSKHLQPTPAGTQLIDPRDGSVISTKAALIKYCCSSNDATARLLKNKRGITDPTLSKIFESILNQKS